MIRQLIIIVCFCLSLQAVADTFVAGKDYVVLPSETSRSANAEHTIIVREFFSYGCPWCSKLESPLLKWSHANKDKITLEKIPVVFHADWQLYAKAFYISKLLGREESLTPILFAKIQDKKQKLNTVEALIKFFGNQGIDEATVRAALTQSPTIELELQQGMRKMAEYQIQAVPAVVVNGRFKTDLQMAGSLERFFEILDFLIQQQRQTI